MKTRIFTLFFLSLFVLIGPVRAEMKASEKETVTYLVSMTCEKCQKRIEGSLSFEKGVTGLKVDLPAKTVTIEYRKDKTSQEKLKAAIKKLGYTVTPYRPRKAAKATR